MKKKEVGGKKKKKKEIVLNGVEKSELFQPLQSTKY